MLGHFFTEYTRSRKRLFAALIVGMMLSTIMSVPLPLLSKFLIDDVMIGGKFSLVPYICILITIIIAVQLGVGRINAWLGAEYCQEFINWTRKKVIQAFVSGKVQSEMQTGNLMVVVSSDITSLSQHSFKIVSTFCTSVFSIVGYLVMMLLLSWKLSILALVFFPMFLLWTMRVSKRMQHLNAEAQRNSEDLLSGLKTLAQHIETIKIYQYVSQQIGFMGEIVDRIGGFLKRVTLYGYFVSAVSSIITSVAGFLPLIAGVYLVAEQAITIGDLVVFNAYCGMLFPPLSALIEVITHRRLASVHEERISALLRNCRQKESNSSPISSQTNYGIEFDDFRLNSDKGILLAVEYFNVEPSSKILVQGDNGVGKSLLLRSMAGLYEKYSGTVLIDDESLAAVNQDSLRQKILYVSPQQGFLLPTIKEELNYSSETSWNEVMSLVMNFEILEILESLPQGIDTSCCGLSERLNTGTLQKLRIIRALSRKPEYLLLDELFSNIEPRQARQILVTIQNAFPHLTLVVVEHHFRFNSFFDCEYKIGTGHLLRVDERNDER